MAVTVVDEMISSASENDHLRVVGCVGHEADVELRTITRSWRTRDEVVVVGNLIRRDFEGQNYYPTANRRCGGASQSQPAARPIT